MKTLNVVRMDHFPIPFKLMMARPTLHHDFLFIFATLSRLLKTIIQIKSPLFRHLEESNARNTHRSTREGEADMARRLVGAECLLSREKWSDKGLSMVRDWLFDAWRLSQHRLLHFSTHQQREDSSYCEFVTFIVIDSVWMMGKIFHVSLFCPSTSFRSQPLNRIV